MDGMDRNVLMDRTGLANSEPTYGTGTSTVHHSPKLKLIFSLTLSRFILSYIELGMIRERAICRGLSRRFTHDKFCGSFGWLVEVDQDAFAQK